MRIGIQQVIVFILIAAILGAASSAGTLTISDPSASLSVDGEERSIDLSGFEARFGRLPDGGLGVNFFGDGNLLLAAEALVDEEGVLLNVDGMSHSCRIDFNSLARMMTGVDPSALDVKALAEILKRGTEIRSTPNSVRVRIPYTTVNELLEELCPFLSQTLDSYDYDALTQALERFRAEDAGYTLEALLTDTERGVAGQLSLLPVQNGRTAIAPLVGLDFTITTDDGASLLFSGEMKGDPNGTGTAMTLGCVYGSLLRAPEGSIKLRFDVLWDEFFEGELKPLLSIDGTVVPVENGMTWDFTYSQTESGMETPTPYARLTGSLLSTDTETALHFELADCYMEETPVPYYAFDLTLRRAAGETVLDFLYSERDYRSGEMKPEEQITLVVCRSESETTAEFTFFEADYRTGEMKPMGRVLLKKTVYMETTSFSLTLSENDYATGELEEIFGLSLMIQRSADGLNLTGALSYREYYEDAASVKFAFEGTVHDEDGDRLVHFDFLIPDGETTMSCFARLDSRYHPASDGAALHAELTYNMNRDGNFVSLVTLDASGGDTVSADLWVLSVGSAHLQFEKSTGTLALSFEAQGYAGSLKVTVSVGEDELIGCPGDPETAIDILEATEEQSLQLRKELRAATAKLVGFLYPAYVQATNG